MSGFWRGTAWLNCRVGTCYGIYRIDPENPKRYLILAVANRHKHNGDFKEFINWFQYNAQKMHGQVRILECWNLRLAYNLYKHGYRLVSWRNLFNWQKQF